MTESLPLQLLVGPPAHGVVRYASDIAVQVVALEPDARVAVAAGVDEALALAASAPRVHVHATDRLFGRSPEAAGDAVAALGERTALTLTLHDLPQPSDGTMMRRRAAAYARMIEAARGVVVNSDHERLLVEEFLPGSREPRVIPLGATSAEVPPSPSPPYSAGPRPLTVLIAGFVYPGKGHEPAIRAAARAAADLRAAGDAVSDVVVRAIGGSSAGHEHDVDELAALASRLGVSFDITGFLDDDRFAASMDADGVPLAAHEHVSASRTMLDWVEAGRHPLVVDSRYAQEMDALRPGTMTRYEPADLAARLVAAWRDPGRTRSTSGASLRPTVCDAARAYVAWWSGPVTG
ncbi:hypothetical protein QL996_14135 [Planococcus sp. APC 4015]|nr:hypothetical protein [Planococcus sp. APC 4015]